MAMVWCNECRGRVSSRAKFCPHCGAVREPDPTPEQEQRRHAALQELTDSVEDYAKSLYGDEAWAVKRREINRNVVRDREKRKQDASKQLLLFAAFVAGILFLMWVMTL